MRAFWIGFGGLGAIWDAAWMGWYLNTHQYGLAAFQAAMFLLMVIFLILWITFD